jgi:hypothetical protein
MSVRWSLLVVALSLSCLPACTVLRYPKHWDGGAPYPSRRPPTAQTPARPGGAPTEAEPPPAAPAFVDTEIDALLDFARSLVGSHDPLTVNDRNFPSDCSGFVCAVYYGVGEDLLPRDYAPDGPVASGTEIIFRHLQEEGGRIFSKDPAPGDLVFFDNTWDRDGNGQIDDLFTHVGIVEQLLPDGTLEILHLANSGIGRIHMNLERPDEYRDEKTGEILNHKLRRRSRSDPPDAPYLTSQLFRAFGRLPSGAH